MSTDNTITDSKHVQSTEPEYAVVIVNPKPSIKESHDVKMHAKHVHSSEQDYDYVATDPKPNVKESHDVKMHVNPAYHVTD